MCVISQLESISMILTYRIVAFHRFQKSFMGLTPEPDVTIQFPAMKTSALQQTSTYRLLRYILRSSRAKF